MEKTAIALYVRFLCKQGSCSDFHGDNSHHDSDYASHVISKGNLHENLVLHRECDVDDNPELSVFLLVSVRQHSLSENLLGQGMVALALPYIWAAALFCATACDFVFLYVYKPLP